jgi:hypothetical protein
LYVLQAWLREDVKPIAREEAEKQARNQAQQTIRSIKQYPKYFSDEQKAITEDQYYEAFIPAWIQRPAGSAAASKGVLAVVAAGGGSEVAPVVQRFLKEWYGTRASQGVNANLKLTHRGDNRQSKSDPPLGTMWHHADAVFFAV